VPPFTAPLAVEDPPLLALLLLELQAASIKLALAKATTALAALFHLLDALSPRT
jgi:hypothetical protein